MVDRSETREACRGPTSARQACLRSEVSAFAQKLRRDQAGRAGAGASRASTQARSRALPHGRGSGDRGSVDWVKLCRMLRRRDHVRATATIAALEQGTKLRGRETGDLFEMLRKAGLVFETEIDGDAFQWIEGSGDTLLRVAQSRSGEPGSGRLMQDRVETTLQCSERHTT